MESWDQVTEAAQQQNWTVLNHYLNQLLDEPRSPESSRSGAIALAVAVLETGDFQSRWDVTKLVSTLGPDAINPMIALLQDEDADPEARWFAARILGGFNDARAIAALSATVQTTEDEELGTMAAEALAHLGTEAIAALTPLLAQPETRRLAVQALSQIRRAETIAPLLSVTTDADAVIRSLAIESLSSFRDPRIPPVLVQALSDPAASVRQNAIVGLGLRPELDAELDLVTLFRDRLGDLNLKVCQQAAIALGRLGTEVALQALAQALNAAPVPLQLEIVRAIGWAETSIALHYLQQALPDVGVEVQQEIIKILGRWTTPNLQPQAAATLIQALQASTDPSSQAAIALALGQLGQPAAIDPLIQLLAHPDPRTRLHATAALKNLPAYEQLQALSRSELPPALREGVAIVLAEWPTQT